LASGISFINNLILKMGKLMTGSGNLLKCQMKKRRKKNK